MAGDADQDRLRDVPAQSHLFRHTTAPRPQPLSRNVTPSAKPRRLADDHSKPAQSDRSSTPPRRSLVPAHAPNDASPLSVHGARTRGTQCLRSPPSAPPRAPRPPPRHASPTSSSRCPSADRSRNQRARRAATARATIRRPAGCLALSRARSTRRRGGKVSGTGGSMAASLWQL
jgi:hypothetical protein